MAATAAKEAPQNSLPSVSHGPSPKWSHDHLPSSFNYCIKKLGADGGTKVATFSTPAASFAAMAEDIKQKKKGGKTGRLRRIHGWADRECEAADASAV